MKNGNTLFRCLLLTGALALSSLVHAQDPEFNFDPGMFAKKDANKRTDLTSFWGFGPTFVTSNNEVEGEYYPEFKPFASWSNDLGIVMRTRFGAPGTKFYLNYGLLWRYINVETDKGALGIMGEDQDPFYSEDDDAVNTELNIHTLSIPLLFEYRSKVSVALGGFAAYRLGSTSELDEKVDGNRLDTQLSADFGLNNLLYGVTAQLGAKRIRLYMNYYLNNLFKDDEPYDFTVMNVGVCWQ